MKFGYTRELPEGYGDPKTVTGFPTIKSARRGIAQAMIDNGYTDRHTAWDLTSTLEIGGSCMVSNVRYTLMRHKGE